MKIFPAIDLRDGRAVRLTQGDYDKMTVYSAQPCGVARRFIRTGARNLHVVDLDGAKDGTPSMANLVEIEALVQQGHAFIEVGGGIRTEERIRQYLDLGVGRCILGTV
ncbi:MAG: HisA/HisF-related TIM barrel protein, partial [Oscillospiraceae bacterium]|nr:HisA/HisF-related TIM barrel protein [Oscillospiraceae bacterium]